MGKLSKLIQKFLSYPPDVRFEEVKYLLEAFKYLEVIMKFNPTTNGSSKVQEGDQFRKEKVIVDPINITTIVT